MMEVLKITTDIEADDVIEQIRDIQEDIIRYKNIAVAKIDAIGNSLDAKTNLLTEQIDLSKAMLRAYMLTVKTKSTKTQSTYGLLTGKLILKKATEKIAHDDKKILVNVEDRFKKLTPSLDWTLYKDSLNFSNGLITDKETGEIITIDGLSINEVAEKFEVKL